MPGQQQNVSETPLRLTLLWVESTTESTAAGAHLRGTVARLVDPRFDPVVYTDQRTAPAWMPSALGKLVRIGSVLGRALLARPQGVFLARWSPFVALVSRRWQRRGLPSVLFVQGNLDDLYDSNPWTRKVPWLTRLALRSITDATEIVTPSQGLCDWVTPMRTHRPSTVTVIPNGVDVALFRSQQSADVPAGSAPHALFFGNMARWQGIDTILTALQDDAWPADLPVWFIGDGQMAEAVRASTDPRVRYLGRRPKADVAREAAAAELTLATRHADGASATGVSPFKIIETAAAGTPCVVTDVPGQVELARDLGGALIVPPDDPAALAAAVARLHHDADLLCRLSETAAKEVTRYDWSAGATTLTGIVLRAAGVELAPPPASASDLNGNAKDGRDDHA